MGRASRGTRDCPFVSERSTYGGHYGHVCNYTGTEISSSDYEWMCQYDDKAIRECPMRRRDYES